MLSALSRAPRRSLAATLCVLVALTLTASPANAESGTLTGLVTADDTGAPLAGVTVNVVKIISDGNGGHSDSWVAGGETGTDGRYSIPEVPAGKAYRVEFTRDGYISEWAHDQDWPLDAKKVTVPGTLDEQLAREAVLSGVVLDEKGKPVSAGYVGASPLSESPLADPASSELGKDGTYRITGLLPGEYTLDVYVKGRPPQYVPGTFHSDEAETFTLERGENTANEKLLPRPTGVVRGTITDKATGKPIKGVCVELGGPVSPVGKNHQCVGADGKYQITGVATQSAYLSILDATDRYVTNDTFSVKPVDGTTVVRDVALEPAARFTATLVVAATGRPVAADTACLFVEPVGRSGFGRGGCAQKSDGKLSIGGLRAGKYIVRVDPWERDSDRYGIGWVKADGSATTDKSQAKVFSVASGKTAAVGTVKVAKGGAISGTIIDKATGKPLKNVCLGIEGYGARSGEFSIRGACTNSKGRYTLHGLSSGGWILQLVSQRPAAWFYSGGAATRAKATPIAVTAGKTARYDVSLLPGAGTLTGTVSAPGAKGYDLDVFNADTQEYVQFGTGGELTGKTRYTVSGISPQNVKIGYWIDGKHRWYGGKDFKTAKVITITAGTTTANIALR